jgi:hypothetical protein
MVDPAVSAGAGAVLGLVDKCGDFNGGRGIRIAGLVELLGFPTPADFSSWIEELTQLGLVVVDQDDEVDLTGNVYVRPAGG